MNNERKFFRCPHCGNLFGMILDGGVTPICCGDPMLELEANTVDAAKEKHVPAVERDGNLLHIQVGAVPHPMLEEHHIAWIAVAQGNHTQRIALQTGEAPKATFVVNDGPVAVYEWCNLHGLWRADA